MSEVIEKSSENDCRLRPRGSRERQVHNELERRRKDKINGWITKIGELLPCKDLHKQSKISLLEQSVEYIKLLSSERDKLLSEKYSEVIANEIDKLKREITFLSEQNVMYKKLLEESNINLSSQPQKQLKYSNKFVHTNGILTVKNTEKEIKSYVNKAIQVSMFGTVPNGRNVGSAKSPAKDSKKISSTGTSKEKQASKLGAAVPKLAKIASAVSSAVKCQAPNTCTPATSIHSSTVGMKSTYTSASVSEVPVINCNDPVQQPPSFHAGGVTTVLPQLPVMSTSHGPSLSTVCNKNVPTIIIPSGGGILPQLVQERASNTFSVLCPNTLPILVPQQVFNMTSIARSVGMQPTIICPAQIDASASQAEKSIGSALFTINSNSIVPISTSFPANTQILLPSQPAFMGTNCCSSLSVTQNVVTPLLAAGSQAHCDHASVPSLQKSNDCPPDKNENKEQEDVSDSDPVEKNNLLSHANDDVVKKSQTTEPVHLSKKEATVQNSSVKNKLKKSNRDLGNMFVNSPPSLQFLSANKIISLASQSQKGRLKVFSNSNQSIRAPAYSESTGKGINDLDSLEMNQKSKVLEIAEFQKIGESEVHNDHEQPITSTGCIKDSTTKSKFSLTVLMGNSAIEHASSLKKSSVTVQNNASIFNVSGKDSESPSTLSSTSTDNVSESQIESSDSSKEISKSRENTASRKLPVSIISSAPNQSMSLSRNNPSDAVRVALCDFNTLSNASSLHSSMNNSDGNECIQKGNSSLSAKQEVKVQNRLQNDLNPTVFDSALGDNNCDEGLPYSGNGTSVDQVLPSLFSSSQLMNLGSQILVCPTGHENNNSLLLSNDIQPSQSNSNHLGDIHGSSVDFSSYSVINKVSPSPATASQGLVAARLIKVHNPDSAVHSSITVANDDEQSKIIEKKKVIEETFGVNRTSQSTSPKSKLDSQSFTSNNAEKSDLNSSTNVSSSILSVNSSANENQLSGEGTSGSKSGSLLCTNRQDVGSFSFSSDILAKATESIFGNDLLDSPQMPKRHENCFVEESSDGNVGLSSAESGVESSYKMMKFNYDQEAVSHLKESLDRNKSSDAQCLTIATPRIPPASENEIGSQEHASKSTKLCKVRKAKAASDCEPPSKKLKASPEKSLHMITVNSSAQINKDDKNSSTAHSNLLFLEKQVSSSALTTVDDPNISLGSFQNQILLSVSNCKTPTSADAIFSLTPMLGDILKDVSHNANFDQRSTNFLATDNQAVFSSEKNSASSNYANSSNEDYLNLPRMYFPILPDAPAPNVTNVSLAHGALLCSTQRDSLKTTETQGSSDLLSKTNTKKKDISHAFLSNQSFSSHDLLTVGALSKQPDCILKINNSDTHFNPLSSKALNNNSSESQFSIPPKVTSYSGVFDNLNSVSPASSIQSTCIVTKSPSQCQLRENFLPPVSQHFSFYPTISNSANIQHFPTSTSVSPRTSYSNHLSSSGSLASTFCGTNSLYNTHPTMSKADSLSHSLCSLLKDSNSDNRVPSNEASTQGPTSSSNNAKSKYSALFLISDQVSYSDPPPAVTGHPQFVQASSVYTSSTSPDHYVTTVSSCGRNPKTSLSYSAESLLQTSCGGAEKNKSKSNSRCFIQSAEKKVDQTGIADVHSLNGTNIFVPVSSGEVSIQNTTLIPLPPVTSFQSFPSNYSVCETVPSSTVFSSVAKITDIPSSHSNENYLSHLNVNVDSQMLSNRLEINVPTTKPLPNIPMPFENQNGLYNNCNFLPHVKPPLENSRSAESSACFQSPYSNNFSQQTQKSNCCHFTHQALAVNPDLASDINLPAVSFHPEKANFPATRTPITQSNSNCMNNFFYNSTTNCRDGNDVSSKPSTNRTSQEIYVPEGIRQNLHDPNASITFNNRKTVQSNRTKSKKLKNASSIENNGLSSCVNYSLSQDCNKTNLSYVPNGYFKSSSHPVLATPSQLQCSQNKMSEAVMPTNPSFNPVLHQQSDNFLNLNFQHSSFTMSPLPRPPTQPLSSSCLTTPIISHTFSTGTPHPVPNFNLSNILPDMGCSSNQVSFSPPKFSVNNSLILPSSQSQTHSSVTNSAHIISHQSCSPSVYPPHPPMVRGALNSIIGHNSQSIMDNHVSNVGPSLSQNTTFSSTQNPSFQNAMHPIPFSRNDHSSYEMSKN